VGEEIRAAGLTVVSLCRGGFFPGLDKAARQAAIADNQRALDEAAALGAPLIVLVCGAVPGQPLAESRCQIKDGITAILPDAERYGIKLAIEPLHPMYAASRSAINTLAQANDLCTALDSPLVGVALDVYHLWWDPHLEGEIRRCGQAGRIFAFHVCDWKTPTEDLLNDRGLMGEGCIPLRQIRGWMEAAGFNGFNEVEIFSNKYWATDQQEFLRAVKTAYLRHV
jgi:sugar phosphate isomerase/epimerase